MMKTMDNPSILPISRIITDKQDKMHELGIMTGVLESATTAAHDANATRLIGIRLSIGEMTEAIEDALQFAFDALKENDPFIEDANLEVNTIRPKSICLECGAEYTHDRFHMFCPECDSFATQLIEGRELRIDSIEVDLPEDEEEGSASNG